MAELMRRFHVRDHYLYILFGRYEKYGIDGLERYRRKRVTPKLKKSVIEDYEKYMLPLWRICVKHDASYASVCRWVQQYRRGGHAELSRHSSRKPPRKDMGRPKKKKPQTELERLQERVRWLEAENALLKKVRALMEEEESRRKGSGQKPSSH